MVLMRPGCYLQSMNNDPASMLAAHWLPSLVFLAGFLLTFPCPITSPPSTSVQENYAHPATHS